MTKRFNFLLPAIAICFAGMVTPAEASRIPEENVTEAEWRLLPPYCPYTMAFSGYTPGSRAKWEPLMGKENFSHMHHYCWALIRFQRAERAITPTDQKRYLRTDALDDFKYVLRNTHKDFILLPELLTWIGRTELLLGKPDDADAAFVRARKIKPDYWPAYSHWAEHLLATGNKEDAMAIVKTGLEHAPTAKVLHEIFRALGGKPDDIPPPVAQESAAPAPQSRH